MSIILWSKSVLNSSSGTISKGQAFIILLLLPLGLIATLMIPVGGGFDEEQHLWRAWEMSALEFIPNSKLGPDLPVPKIFFDMSYRQQPIIRPVEPGFWSDYGDLPIDAEGWVYDQASTRSVYSPALLLPQSMILRYLWSKFDLPALPVFYLARIVGLISYIFLALLAVYLIPYGKWMLSILAVAPMALFQASTISADPLSTGIGLLFIGGSLAIASVTELDWKHWGGILLLISLLFLAKVNLIPLVLLPFLIIRPSQFKARPAYILLVVTTCLLFGIEVVGWQFIVSSVDTASTEGSTIVTRLLYLLLHPGEYSLSLVADLGKNGLYYLRGWIAAYGYYYWQVPTLTYVLYGLALLTSLFFDKGPLSPSRRERIAFLIILVIGYLATAISLQLTAEPLGSTTAHELHGRYFTAILPLGMFALLGLPFTEKLSIPSWLGVALTTAALMVYTAGLVLSYHVVCGNSFYSFRVCYQPQYKNWAPDQVFSPPISDDLTLAQEFVAECEGLSHVRVWTDASNSDPDGMTSFSITRAKDQRTIYNQSISNNSILSGDWIYLIFPTEYDSINNVYLLEIQPSGESESLGPRFGYTVLREYELGDLFENDVPINQDLFFQYGCRTGLGGIWARISAAGR